MKIQYLWSQSAIDSITKNNKLSEFSNPVENTVMNEDHLQNWKSILNDDNITFEKLECFDLAVKNVIIKNVKKVKIKQKKIVKKKNES